MNETKEYAEEASTLSVDVPAFRTGFPTSFEWHGAPWLKWCDHRNSEGELEWVKYTGYCQVLTVFND